MYPPISRFSFSKHIHGEDMKFQRVPVVIAILLTSLMMSPNAFAYNQSVPGSKVIQLGMGNIPSYCNGNCVLVKLDIEPTVGTIAPCHCSGSFYCGWHFALDLNDPNANSMVSMLLAAKVAGIPVEINAPGTCVGQFQKIGTLILRP